MNDIITDQTTNNELATVNAAVHEIELIIKPEKLDHKKLVDFLTRVVLTKKELSLDEDDPTTIYQTMKKVCSSMQRFPGDEEFFYKIYKIIAGFEDKDVLLIVQSAEYQERSVVEKPLFNLFSTYITPQVHSIFIPDADGYGPKLLELVKSHPEITFTLKFNHHSTLLSFIYSKLKNIHIETNDPYKLMDESIKEKFDLIFSFPQLNAAYWDPDIEEKWGKELMDIPTILNSAEGEIDLPFLALKKLPHHLKDGGKLIIDQPKKIAYAGGNLAKLRKYLMDNYKVEEIASVPNEAIDSEYSLPTSVYLLVISTGQTGEVSMKQYSLEDKSTLVIKNLKIVPAEKFKALKNWNVDFSFTQEDETQLETYKSSSTPKAQLKDIATILRGKSITSKDFVENGNIAVISISDLNETGIDYDHLQCIKEDMPKALRYILEDGDVLLSTRGSTTPKVGLFNKQSFPCITYANMCVIRPTKDIKGAYLKLFLESPTGISLLKSIQRGNNILNINYADVAELEVPLLPMEEQDALIKQYNSAISSYKDAIDAAAKNKQSVIDDIRSKLF